MVLPVVSDMPGRLEFHTSSRWCCFSYRKNAYSILMVKIVHAGQTAPGYFIDIGHTTTTGIRVANLWLQHGGYHAQGSGN